MEDPALDAALFRARADVLADLAARGLDDAEAVSLLEESCAQRRWWLEQWPAGTEFIAGLIAQDVQDSLTAWPLCTLSGTDDPEHEDLPAHALRIDPELGGPDPHWICEEAGLPVAPLGRLS